MIQMKTNRLNLRCLTSTIVMLLYASMSSAGAKIEINEGADWIVVGGNLKLTCDDLVRLVDGGVLEIFSGSISELNIKGTGFRKSGGKVLTCESFYLIPTKDGKAAIINM